MEQCPSCKQEVGFLHLQDCKVAIADTLVEPMEDKPAVTETEVSQLESAINFGDVSNGDCYDEDTGEYLGQLESGLIEGTVPMTGPDAAIPAQISMYFNGYYYVFKPTNRYKEEKTDETPDTARRTG